jgi:hypothetical protein
MQNPKRQYIIWALALIYQSLGEFHEAVCQIEAKVKSASPPMLVHEPPMLKPILPAMSV